MLEFDREAGGLLSIIVLVRQGQHDAARTQLNALPKKERHDARNAVAAATGVVL